MDAGLQAEQSLAGRYGLRSQRRFPLKTETTDKPRTARYRRLNSRTGRTAPGRVCWHGTRDFLRAFFARVPDARVRTAMATYKGAADFERTHRDTWDQRADYMGYLMAAPADQMCTCGEGGAR